MLSIAYWGSSLPNRSRRRPHEGRIAPSSFFCASQDRQECGTRSPLTTQVRYCPCRSGARQRRNVDTPKKTRKIAHSQSMFPAIPSSAIAEPPPDMPELEIPGHDHGEHHTEHKAHAKTHNADQKDRAQTAAVSMCWERNSEISYPQQSRVRSSSIRRPNTPFRSNAHWSAPFICRTFTTVFNSAASKIQPGFLRNLGASFCVHVHRRDWQS